MSTSKIPLGLTDSIKAIEEIIIQCKEFKQRTPSFYTVSIPSTVDTEGMDAADVIELPSVVKEHPIDDVLCGLASIRSKLIQMYGHGLWEEARVMDDWKVDDGS